jgi:hypothetical protein
LARPRKFLAHDPGTYPFNIKKSVKAFDRASNRFGYNTSDQDEAGVAPEDHPDNHALASVLAKHGYEIDETIPVDTDDDEVRLHHTWINQAGHLVHAYADDDAFRSKTSATSGHSFVGKGSDELDQHLANRARRYKIQNNESKQIPNTDLMENLLKPEATDQVQGYLDYINRQPASWSSMSEKTSPAQELKNTWAMKDRQSQLFGDGIQSTDGETRGLMGETQTK